MQLAPSLCGTSTAAWIDAHVSHRWQRDNGRRYCFCRSAGSLGGRSRALIAIHPPNRRACSSKPYYLCWIHLVGCFPFSGSIRPSRSVQLSLSLCSLWLLPHSCLWGHGWYILSRRSCQRRRPAVMFTRSRFVSLRCKVIVIAVDIAFWCLAAGDSYLKSSPSW